MLFRSKCHNQRGKAGGLTLDDLSVEDVAKGAETWEKVLRKLRTNRMPPKGNPRPDEAERGHTLAWLESSLDKVSGASPNPGRASVHRLNRFEYANAIRDLLALEIDAPSLLPGDNSGYGFDNIADVLAVSPGLMERYLIAADKISRLAVGDDTIRPQAETLRIPYLVLRQEERMSNDLPAGSRGGVAFEHNFPLDGEYAVLVDMLKDYGDQWKGRHEDSLVDVRLDGARLRTITIEKSTKNTSIMASDGQKPNPGPQEVRFQTTAGVHTITVALVKRTVVTEGVGPDRLPMATPCALPRRHRSPPCPS
mgnify:CR=1 FL=1